MQTMCEALSFLSEQVSSLRLGAHLYDAEANLQPLSSAFNSIAKAQREANHMILIQQQQQQQVQQQQTATTPANAAAPQQTA